MSGKLSEREKKKRDETNVKILQELLALPDNQGCADCGERGPRWASVNLGVFLCIRCGGLHRKLGTHISKVKSITLDSWTPEQIEVMREWGNKKANEKFLAGGGPPVPSHSDYDMEMYIRNKYEKRVFEKPGGAFRIQDANLAQDANLYASQLATLSGMGFQDQGRNIVALKRANGNLDTAVELIVSMEKKGNDSSSKGGNIRATASAARTMPQNQIPPRSSSMSATVSQAALASLRAMGFDNDEENAQALKAANGSLETAANMLLDAKNRKGANSSAVPPALPQRNETAASPEFVLEPPVSRGSNSRAGRLPQQAVQPKPTSADPFAGFGGDIFSTSQQPQQPQQVAHSSNPLTDMFGNSNEASAQASVPQPQPVRTAPAKESIMSLFNTPAQQPQMMNFGMPHQGGMGYPNQAGVYGQQMPQQAIFGVGPQSFGQQIPQQAMFAAGPQMTMQRMGMGIQQGAGMNPFMAQQQQQPAYVYAPRPQNNPFNSASAPYNPPAPSVPRAAHDFQTGGQPEQQHKPDPFASIGPSFAGRSATQQQGQQGQQGVPGGQNLFF